MGLLLLNLRRMLRKMMICKEGEGRRRKKEGRRKEERKKERKKERKEGRKEKERKRKKERREKWCFLCSIFVVRKEKIGRARVT